MRVLQRIIIVVCVLGFLLIGFACLGTLATAVLK